MQGHGSAIPGGGAITSQSPPFAVPIRYMLLGVICFGLFAVDFACQSMSLAKEIPGAQNIVALTHLLTLGALLSFVMGAVYQLTTVAFLIPIASIPAARWNFWLYVVAFIGLLWAMSTWSVIGFLTFGSLMAASVYIYAIVLMVSLFRTKMRGPMFGFVVSAHMYLILAVSVAVLLVLVDAGMAPALSNWMGPLIATHILLAVGGFFTFLVMGFTLKLLPMFTLSHNFTTWRQKWTLLLAHFSMWVVMIGVWTHFYMMWWVGALIGILAFVSHIMDIRNIFQKRMRKKVEPPIRAVLAAMIAGVLGLCLVLVRLLWPQGEAGWQGVLMFYLFGVVTLTVMGFAYKIVPFLVWTKRYSKLSGKGKPILISDLLNLNRARFVLSGFGVGFVVLTGSDVVRCEPVLISSCVLISIATVFFCVQILKVMEPLKLTKELLERD